MARPKVEEKEQRKNSVMVRFSDSEFERLNYFCDQTHKNKSEFLRDLFLERKFKVVQQTTINIPEMQNLMKEFSQIGNNINQLTKYFNEGNGGNDSTPAIKKELGNCLTELHSLNIKCNKLIKSFSKGGDS